MRSDRYKDSSNYQAPVRSERERVPEPVIHNTRAKKKRSKAPLIILLVLVFLAGAGFGGYYYYSHYMKPIKVNVWDFVQEPTFTGLNGEGVPGAVLIDEKKFKKVLTKVENKYTADRAKDLKNIVSKMTFEVTPNTQLSNGTAVDVICKYDYKAADNARIDFEMKDGKNPETLTKKFKVKGLQKEADLSEILSSFKDRANGYIPNSTYEKFYQLTKGNDMKLAAIVSVVTDGKLAYRCIMTETITKTNALTVGFSEYAIGPNITDHNQFLSSFKSKGYSYIEI